MHEPTNPLAESPNPPMQHGPKVDLLEQMKQCISYCPETGDFTNIRGGNGKNKGTRMGCINSKGYVQISFKRKTCLAHRVAWGFVYGSFPEKGLMIDHINGDRADNRIANLRVVDCEQNLQNRRTPGVRSKLGVLGVSKESNRFRSKIVAGGVLHRLGSFTTIEAASAAYIEAKRRLHKTCTI